MTPSRQPAGLAHPASHCLLKNDSRAGRGRMSLLIALCLAVTIASAAIAGYCYQSHRQIMTAARTGRISLPEGVYYVTPAPTFDEVEQLREDVATLNRRLNRHRK